MRKTLFRQLITYMMIFCFVLCAVCYAVIAIFFDDYYYAQQQQSLLAHSGALAAQYDADGDIEALIAAYYSEYGVSFHFLDLKTGDFTGTSTQGMGRQGIMATMTQENIGRVFVSTTAAGMGQGTGHGSQQWLSYLSKTQDGNLLLARVSYESMDSVVALVQQFFLYFGIAIAAAFVVFAFFFSRSVSRPLHELNSIAGEMGKLNFSMRYDGNRRDEIGQLGTTLNTLTTQLENTISQLQGELSKEKTLEKMRTQFTAQVSHELQTPLAVIRGYAEALADGVYAGKETPEVYHMLLNEAEKISRMVDDLLNLSQMESGVYVLSKQKFSLAALLEKIVARYRNLPNERPFSLHLQTDVPDGATFFGDPLRIEQAVRNVLTNALKHVTGSGNIFVTLSVQGQTALITIENEGTPIPQDEMPYIFDSYFRGKAESRGTGLGLAITRHIAALHGGTITASNTEKGVRMQISLPQ